MFALAGEKTAVIVRWGSEDGISKKKNYFWQDDEEGKESGQLA